MSVASDYHWRPYRCPRSGLPLGAMVTFRPSCCQGPCLGLWTYSRWRGSALKLEASVATKGPMEAWGLGCNLWPCWCPEGWSTTRTMMIWVACAATRSHGATQAQAAAEGHVWIHSPAVAAVRVMSVACVTTLVIGTMCGEIRGACLAGPALCWPCPSGHCSKRAAHCRHSGEMVPPPHHGHGCRRAGSAPHRKGAAPVAQLSYYLGPHPVPWVDPP